MSNSFTYRFLRKIGLNFSEGEYGNVSLLSALKRFIIRVRNGFLLKYSMYSMLLSPFNSRFIRARVWRWMGAKVGKGVFIGYEVLMDNSYAKLIELEDNVHIANRCILLCHQRDMRDYHRGDDYSRLPYRKGKILLKSGCLIGTNSMIMPGVTVGEGAIVGAYSLVTKDVPARTVVTGRPAKVVKIIEEK